MHFSLILVLFVTHGSYTHARRIVQYSKSESEPLLDILSMLESGNNSNDMGNIVKNSTAEVHSHGHTPESPVGHSDTSFSLPGTKAAEAKGHFVKGDAAVALNNEVKGVVKPAGSLTGSDLLAANSRDGLITLLTQGRSAVSDLQTSVAFLDAAKRLQDRAASVRHEVELDVLALNATVQQEYENVSRLRFFEKQQDKVLRAQLSYLTPAATPQHLQNELDFEGPSEFLLEQAEPSHRETLGLGSGGALTTPSFFTAVFTSVVLLLVVTHHAL